MRRIDTPNKALNLFGAGKHGFKNGLPGTTDRPTEGQAEFFNAIQEEVSAPIEAAGLVLDAGSNSQLLAAIRLLAGPSNPYLTTVVIGDGMTDKSAQLTAANVLARPLQIFGICVVGTPTTITVPIVDTMANIFSTTAQITIDNGLPVRPEWFGSASGNIRLAVNALPATGGVVKLENKTYPPSYNTLTSAKILANTGVAGVDYLAKANVSLLGGRLPTFNSTNTALSNGSIIQGPFYVFAPGFRWDNIGVDSGSDVCTALYAGAAQDGFDFCKPNHVAGGAVSDVQIGRVVGLGASDTLAGHAVLIEAIDSGSVLYAEGRRSLHNVVVKSKNMACGKLRGFGSTLENVIFKSDDYGVMDNVTVESIEFGALTLSLEAGFGVLVDAVTANGGKVTIGRIKGQYKANGVAVRSNGSSCADVQIGQAMVDQCSNSYVLSGDVRRVHLGALIANNTTNAVRSDGNVTHKSNSIGRVVATNCTDVVNADATAPKIGSLTVDGSTGYVLNHTTVNTRIFVEECSLISSTNFWQLQPAFANSWTQFAAGATFRLVTVPGGRVKLSGKIVPGSGSQFCGALSTQIRPSEELEFQCVGFNGATPVAVVLRITTAGIASIVNYTSAPTYVILDAEWPIPY